jgi:2-polyprenyl-3-methyl-5-hydroxy-6-metoxy-1,4-benzoquinol methylase
MITKIGKKVQEFYNEIPFPDYELKRFNNAEDLKVSVYPFAKILDRSIPSDASIIDVGTGTGMTSAFLSLRREKVLGIDFSDSSLKKAKALKKKLKLNSWALEKINLLDEKQIENILQKYGKFDYVLCLGVLHHTGNARKGLENICKLLNPNGKIAVGLYHKVGRIPLKIRIILAKTIFKNNQKIKDYFIKMQIGDVEDKERARGWWHDQYLHVHETTHTVGEVLRWFKENNIKYIQSVPTLNLNGEVNLEIAGVWNGGGHPYLIKRLYKQFTWLWKNQREGGYWITFGENQ